MLSKTIKFSPVQKSARSQNGFTLVEVMIGMLVLSISIAGVTGLIAQSFFCLENSRKLNHVSQVLQTEIENIRTYSWAEIEAMPFWSEFEPSVGTLDLSKLNLVCERYVFDSKANQKKIRLMASWTDLRSITHTRSYETYYTKEGLSDYFSRAL